MLSKKIAATVWMAISIPLGSGAASPGGSAAIRIDTTSSRFAFDGFTFRVNPQTGAAAIQLEYSYPAYRLFGDETYRDPGPRIATLPGLIYDQSAHEIIYQDGTTRTACAVKVGHRVKNTGACLVTSHVSHHTESDGWTKSGFDTRDTYFEVRGR